ncbi:MAG TPA: FAD/NAD(P)-binding protein [Holophagaceae bacterium]|nr:FAD/NAD(P)-binding protein [Holophagaceae bacterium]
MDHFDIVIIGAGASGVLTAAHLRQVSPESSVALMDAGARAARGLAYGTPYGAHLLNVPAGRMSAFAHDPGHFSAWMERSGSGPAAGFFAPRSLYGEYLAEVLARTCAPPSRTSRIPGTVVGLVPGHEDAVWEVHLHDGQVVGARVVVLALGNLAPSDPLRLGADAPEGYLRDPWGPGAAQGLPPQAPILIIGAGLTMVDLLLALRAEGHEGTVHAISRHGLLPRAHASYAQRPIAAPAGLTPRGALRWIRREIAAAGVEGNDWRSVIDGLRASTQDLWASWTLAQRSSFLRHARAYWDVHRHRTAPEVGSQVEALLASGVLEVHAGRIQSLREAEGGIEVRWTARADGEHHTLQVARVINCTGPASDYGSLDQPLVAQLRRAGWLVPDALRLGVETDADGRLLGKDGKAVPGLFTLGPLRRAALWESTAIPEIRGQAAALAALLSVL